ncbi:MAG: NADH-quinone oxidoreductase subunit H, partial [Nitrospirota bacterium]
MDWSHTALTIGVILGGALTLAGLLIWVERRLLGIWQERYGPNRLGPG